MHRIVLAAALCALTSAAAVAQTPAGVRFVPVPDNAILGSNVKGLAVYNDNRDKVGTIEDEVVESGRLAGYILSIGGFLGMGEHYVVVAPAGLSVSYDQAAKVWHARIDATKDQLKAAPAFTYEGRWAK